MRIDIGMDVWNEGKIWFTDVSERREDKFFRQPRRSRLVDQVVQKPKHLCELGSTLSKLMILVRLVFYHEMTILNLPGLQLFKTSEINSYNASLH